MVDILRAAKRLQRVCEQSGWEFCFIGGVAVQRWGELRITKDADATIYTGFGEERPYISRLLKTFKPRREDAAEFALIHRVLLLQDPMKPVGLDVSFGAFPYERGAIERSSYFAFQRQLLLKTCSAEDLIVFKAFADRDLDWHDVKGILIRQQGKLDFDIVERELPPLVALKEEPAILDKWAKLRQRYR